MFSDLGIFLLDLVQGVDVGDLDFFGKFFEKFFQMKFLIDAFLYIVCIVCA